MKRTFLNKITISICLSIGIVYAFFAHYYYQKFSGAFIDNLLHFVTRTIIASLICFFLIVILSEAQRNKEFLFFDVPSDHKSKGIIILKYSIALSILWLPLLVVKYPGALCWDTWDMIHMYRINAITTHHSVVYTVIIGRIINSFEHMGAVNYGLFLFVAAHYIFYVISFSYSLYVIKTTGAKKWVITAASCFWVINPYIAGYIGVGIKDSLYAAAMVLITALLIEMSNNTQLFISSTTNIIALFASITLACLVRKNGVYLAAFMIVAALIRTKKDKNYRVIAGIIALSIVAMYGSNYVLSIKYNVHPGSISEALSVPFQQTARYVKYYSSEVASDEMKAIDDVLDYERLPELYNPKKSDYVKGTYKGDNRKLIPYFAVWLKQFTKHPGCYLAAFANQNLYAFVPQANKHNIVLYQDDKIGYEAGKIVNVEKSSNLYEPIFHNPKILTQSKMRVVEFYKSIYERTPIGISCNIAICTYLFLIMFLKQIADKKDVIMEFSVDLIALLFALLGPAVYGHPRYLFPIVYTIPTLMIYCLKDRPHKEN